VVNAFFNLNGFGIFFAICNIVGGFFVLVKLVLQFVGADAGRATG